MDNDPEERKFQPFGGGRLKARKEVCSFYSSLIIIVVVI
jgi:hypothetical protein